MKRFVFLISLCAISVIGLFSQADVARILFYRPVSYKGSVLAAKILVDGKEIGRLSVGERLIYETRSFGERTITFVMVNLQEERKINITPGSENYYLVDFGFKGLICQLMEPSVGTGEFNNSKKFKKNSEPVLVSESAVPGNLASDATGPSNVTAVPVNQPVTENVPAKNPIKNYATGKRLALVIGNSAYKNASYLRNPSNDARDMGKVLQSVGFEVMLYIDQDLNSMKQSVDNFGLKLKDYDIGLFYYAGHGIQSKGFNYFIPVDADLKTEAQVEFNCVRTDRLLSLMADAGNSTNIIILDACRDNPFERSWRRSATGSGLAFMDAPSGSLIAYSTSPGKTASDGSGKNGLYTSALLKHLPEPNITIEEMFKKVREEVNNLSGKQQIPWESTSLVGTFIFSVKNE